MACYEVSWQFSFIYYHGILNNLQKLLNHSVFQIVVKKYNENEVIRRFEINEFLGSYNGLKDKLC